ncbi:MAG TPA: flagellar motor switch protein FliG [Bryobacteraceae bacterium]|nr:flagellar motor switch protein FliG [Bryobacteraceae bacterium]
MNQEMEAIRFHTGRPDYALVSRWLQSCNFTRYMATMTAPVAALPAAPSPQGEAKRSEMRGVRKAAILLTTLGDDTCAAILRQLTEEQVHDVTREISRLTGVSDDERRHVLEEFASAHSNAGLFGSGGIEYATSVLVTAFGPETGKRMADRVLKSLGFEMATIDSLQKADPQALAKVIHREHPQTIALILSHVGPSHAAKLLAALPATLRPDVARRMATLDQISPEVVNKIAKTIGAKLRLLGETSLEAFGGVRAVAEVLNRVDTSTSEEILKQVTDDDPNLGQTIKNLMFVFEDLLHVDQQAMRTIVGKLDRKVLVMALKGSASRIKDHFTGLMSARAAEMLAEDMEALGPVRIRDVEEAQQQIIAIARQMEAEGALSLRPSSGDKFVV